MKPGSTVVCLPITRVLCSRRFDSGEPESHPPNVSMSSLLVDWHGRVHPHLRVLSPVPALAIFWVWQLLSSAIVRRGLYQHPVNAQVTTLSELPHHDLDEAVCDRASHARIGSFHHHADERLGTRGPHEHSALIAKFLLSGTYGIVHRAAGGQP